MTLDLPTGLGATVAFLLGASVGSFVSVLAWRLPRELSIVSPGSRCDSCERTIPWWANIPILAYLGLRGRCIMCGATIPSALWVVAIIDYDWRLIPNLITWPGMLVGFLAASLMMPEIGWKNSLLGILLGGGVLYFTGFLYQLVRGREGVGLGDVWLLGMVGGFLGWTGVFFTLFVGSIIGAIGGIAFALSGGPKNSPAPVADPATDPEEADVSILRTEVPFGPFLALAAGIFTLFQPQLTHWYLGA